MPSLDTFRIIQSAFEVMQETQTANWDFINLQFWLTIMNPNGDILAQVFVHDRNEDVDSTKFDKEPSELKAYTALKTGKPTGFSRIGITKLDTFTRKPCNKKGGFICLKDGYAVGSFGISGQPENFILTLGVRILQLSGLEFDPTFYKPNLTFEILKPDLTKCESGIDY
jgi:uncharacterized protein GlcG (DUF336 family)